MFIQEDDTGDSSSEVSDSSDSYAEIQSGTKKDKAETDGKSETNPNEGEWMVKVIARGEEHIIRVRSKFLYVHKPAFNNSDGKLQAESSKEKKEVMQHKKLHYIASEPKLGEGHKNSNTTKCTCSVLRMIVSLGQSHDPTCVRSNSFKRNVKRKEAAQRGAADWLASLPALPKALDEMF